MTVSSSVSKSIYVGNGVARDWDITFPINGITEDEVKVYLTNDEGVSTLLTGDYDVNLTTLKVTYPTIASGLDPIDSSQGVVISRELALTQTVELTNQGPLPAKSIEAAFDRLEMQIQQLNEKLSRTAVADISESGTALEVQGLLQSVQDSQALTQAAATAAAASASSASSNATASAASAASAAISEAAASAAAATGRRTKVVAITKNIADASTTLAVTGAGFTPRAAVIFVSGDTASKTSHGMDDGTTTRAVFLHGTDLTWNIWTTGSMIAHASSGNYTEGKFNSFTSDGGIIGFTKSGTPTGTVNIQILFIE